MKAWLCEEYSDPVNLVLRDVPVRDPGPGEVQIAMRATGVTFGETLIMKGQYQLSPALPFIPSSDLAGVVSAVGGETEGFRVGDPVIGVSFSLSGGGLQEFCTLPQHQLFPMPAALGFVEAAALTSDYYTAYHALFRRGQLQPGETLVVHGASGGVGVAAVKIGRLLGARVIATGRDDGLLAQLPSLGAHDVVNSKAQPVHEAIKALTAGRGADVIFDPVGGDVFDASMRAIAPGGRILVVGFTSGRAAVARTDIMLVKMISVIGIEGRLSIETTGGRGMADYRDLLRLAEMGLVRPHVGRVVPFAEADTAYCALEARDAVGKIVVSNEIPL